VCPPRAARSGPWPNSRGSCSTLVLTGSSRCGCSKPRRACAAASWPAPAGTFELQRKRLEASKQLGDLDGIAGADWGLARIDLEREDYQAALPRLTESFQILGRLQRPDGIAVVGSTLGQLLIAEGQDGQARQVLQASLAAAGKLGWADLVRQISQLLNPPPQEGKGT
jgi:hypothetical protein